MGQEVIKVSGIIIELMQLLCVLPHRRYQEMMSHIRIVSFMME